MIQEVQIVLTIEVDTSKSKKEIEAFFLDMEETYTRTVSSKNRWEFPKITLVEIKEESEIYQTERQFSMSDMQEAFKAGDDFRLYLDKNATGMGFPYDKEIPSTDKILETMSFEKWIKSKT